jgi:hypothetical protein
MKKKLLGIFVCSMLVIIMVPVATAVEYYPPEDGPYYIYLCGRSFGYGTQQVKFRIGPFWWIESPFSLGYNVYRGSIIIINRKITLIPDEYFISLFGFKGFGAGHFLFLLKGMTLTRIRAFGICDAIELFEIPS